LPTTVDEARATDQQQTYSIHCKLPTVHSENGSQLQKLEWTKYTRSPWSLKLEGTRHTGPIGQLRLWLLVHIRWNIQDGDQDGRRDINLFLSILQLNWWDTGHIYIYRSIACRPAARVPIVSVAGQLRGMRRRSIPRVSRYKSAADAPCNWPVSFGEPRDNSRRPDAPLVGRRFHPGHGVSGDVSYTSIVP